MVPLAMHHIIVLAICYVLQFVTPFSSDLHPQQGEACGNNFRFVVDEDHNDKFRIERVEM